MKKIKDTSKKDHVQDEIKKNYIESVHQSIMYSEESIRYAKSMIEILKQTIPTEQKRIKLEQKQLKKYE